MKRLLSILFGVLLMISCSTHVPTESNPLTPIPFTSVHLDDEFWAPRIETNRTVSIPSAFAQCEKTGRLHNFALAGGLIQGEHQGDFPFDDTDVYKVLEGASYTLAVRYDSKLDAYLDSVINLIGIAQEDDGYLYTCLTNHCERLNRWYGKGRWDRLNSHELYNCGHLYEAAVAHFQATGKRSLLDIAIRNANLIDQVFGPEPGKKKVPSGHPIIEMALVKLHRATGDSKYLKLARFFIDETGKGTDGHRLSEYSQDHKPIVDQDEAVGHAVRFGYLYSGVTDVASLQHDTMLMAATRRVWENVVSHKLYITGGIGSRAQGEGFGPNDELPNMTAYCETCASISNVYWNYRMFLNEKNAKYFDVLERALYNGVLSGVSLSGDKFFYDNPLESVHNHDRAPWFGCACCPGNITRFMASVPGYQYAVGNESLWVNLYAAGSANIAVGNDTIQLHQVTRYPWEGKVTIEINSATDRKIGIYIRIPGWATGEPVPSALYKSTENGRLKTIFTLNGKEKAPRIENGYALFRQVWKSGDRIEIEFPMTVQAVVAYPSITNNNDKVAFQRGPIVYCFEDRDNQNGWMFDCYVNPTLPVEATYERELLGGVVTLSTEGHKVINRDGRRITEPTPLKAIPYYAWNNRGTANMLIWMASTEKTAIPQPQPSKVDSVHPFASTDWAPGLNDRFDPKRSADTDKSYFYWWLKTGSDEHVEYRFDNPVELTQSSVYWLNMDHYETSYRVPAKWSLEYRNNKGVWLPVETKEPFTTNLDSYNTVHFKPVTTSALRLNATLQKEFSAGILEWKVD